MREFLRSRSADIAAILGSWLGALMIIGESESSGRIQGDTSFWLLLIAWVATLSLWWRRSHPVAVALFLVPVSMLTDAAAFAVMVALYTLITRRRGRIIVALVALHFGASLVYSVTRPDPVLPPAT